jgi:hypothetical protein
LRNNCYLAIEIFKENLTQHIVLGVKGFYRRANLIPNQWKLRIGATHELYTKDVDYNVQIQGLPGRMTGYWRDEIEKGHKTGPYRTHIKAIEAYEKVYEDPFGNNSYKCAGFIKNKGRVNAKPIMLSPENIIGLNSIDKPIPKDITISHLEEFSNMKDLNNRWKEINPEFNKIIRAPKKNDDKNETVGTVKLN